MISSKRSFFSFDSFSCFSSSVWFGLDGPEEMLRPELGDELIGWFGCEANDENKSDEYFLTSAYSTVGEVVGIGSSIMSIERLRRSGGSTLGDLVGAEVDCFMGLVLLNEDLEEWRGLTSGGIEEESWRTGGLGGGESSDDLEESNDLELDRLRCKSFVRSCVCEKVEPGITLLLLRIQNIISISFIISINYLHCKTKSI